MLKAKDGAKVLQLVPVPMQEKDHAIGNTGRHFTTYDSSLVCYFEDPKRPDTPWEAGDVWFLAVMDDGSVRPIGLNPWAEDCWALGFMDEMISAEDAKICARN